MHILCPHCQNPVEVVALPVRGELSCTACGSSFRVAQSSTTGWSSPTGETLDRFEILGTLGQGGFGTVYEARDPKLDRVVAVKVPRRDNIGPREQDRDRFLREARSAAQLRHPSIVAVHEVGVVDDVTYLVSDFVEGVTLADRLTAGRPTTREAAEIVAAVAEALQYAHSQGVIHRDIKPSNLMLRLDGSPVVMDFGLAKRDAGEITMTMEGQVLGTPAYMSPEQARGEGHRVDGRCDGYSLGVIAGLPHYIMLNSLENFAKEFVIPSCFKPLGDSATLAWRSPEQGLRRGDQSTRQRRVTPHRRRRGGERGSNLISVRSEPWEVRARRMGMRRD